MTDRSRFIKVPISKELENKLIRFCEKENLVWVDFVNSAIEEKLAKEEKERMKRELQGN